MNFPFWRTCIFFLLRTIAATAKKIQVRPSLIIHNNKFAK